MRYRLNNLGWGSTDVHACQLRPNLGENTNVGPVDHIWLEEFQECSVGVVAFELAHAFDVLKFLNDKRTVGVTFTVYESEHGMALFPTILACEPTGWFGKEAHADEQEDGWDHLDPPWDAEGGGAINLGAAIGYVKHDHDAPGDCPLLSANQTTPLTWWSQFRDVNGDLGGADTHADTVYETANDQHANVLGSANNDGADDPVIGLIETNYRYWWLEPDVLPDTCTNHDRGLSTKHVGKETGAQSSDPRPSSHWSSDATLNVRSRASAVVPCGRCWTLIEVAFVLWCANNGRHRRDVETALG